MKPVKPYERNPFHIWTGFAELDHLFHLHNGVFRTGDLITIAGRAASGKTAFIHQIIDNIAVPIWDDRSIAVGLICMEMSAARIFDRFVGLGVNETSLDRLTNMKITVDDKPSWDLEELQKRIIEMKINDNINLIVIDYIQLMYNHNSKLQISVLSSSLKVLARELNIPIIVISQFEQRIPINICRKPQLSDVPHPFDEDADLILLISNDESGIEVIIAKDRLGARGSAQIDLPLVPLLPLPNGVCRSKHYSVQVEKIIFHDAFNHFAILETYHEQSKMIIQGDVGPLYSKRGKTLKKLVGSTITVSGNWEKHKEHGWTLRFSTLEIMR